MYREARSKKYLRASNGEQSFPSVPILPQYWPGAILRYYPGDGLCSGYFTALPPCPNLQPIIIAFTVGCSKNDKSRGESIREKGQPQQLPKTKLNGQQLRKGLKILPRMIRTRILLLALKIRLVSARGTYHTALRLQKSPENKIVTRHRARGVDKRNLRQTALERAARRVTLNPQEMDVVDWFTIKHHPVSIVNEIVTIRSARALDALNIAANHTRLDIRIWDIAQPLNEVGLRLLEYSTTGTEIQQARLQLERKLTEWVMAARKIPRWITHVWVTAYPPIWADTKEVEVFLARMQCYALFKTNGRVSWNQEVRRPLPATLNISSTCISSSSHSCDIIDRLSCTDM